VSDKHWDPAICLEKFELEVQDEPDEGAEMSATEEG
jgi:hypothetical protein